MNDDFLRNLRRSPSAAFNRQLRERLREQELDETSRRHPNWKLLMIAMLVGGTALATTTYLALSRAPSPSTPTTQTVTESISLQSSSAGQDAADQTNRFGDGDDSEETWTGETSASTAQPTTSRGAARDNRPPAPSSTSGSNAEATRYVSSTGSPTSTSTRSFRIVASPGIAALVKDTTPDSRYTPSVSFEVDTANKALSALCADKTADRPDVVVTSRRARKEEFKLCRKHLEDVLEATIGHIAIVVTRAKSGAPMELSTRTLQLALLKRVPAPDNSSQLIDNPYTHWNQIDPALEERRIEVLGPAPGTPEFLALAAILLMPTCEDNGSPDKQICTSVREDGVYTAARFDANFVPQRLWSDPNVVAIMEYRFYAENSADLLGSLLPGAAPTRESLVEGSYIGACTLRAYVNGDRYGYSSKSRSVVNEYLRLLAYPHRSVIIPPDGTLDGRRLYDAGPKLTAMKLD